MKAQKGESGLTDESGSLIPKKMAKPEIPMFFDDMKKKTLTEKEKEAARSKYNAMSKAEQEKYEEKLLKKQWQNVVRGVIRIYRFTQK